MVERFSCALFSMKFVVRDDGKSRFGFADGCPKQGATAILASISPKGSALQFEPRDQFEQRQKKLEQIQALGYEPFPREFRWTDTPAALVEKYGEMSAAELEADKHEVRVAGRLVSLRLMGKAGFAHLQGSGKRLQIYVKKDVVGEHGFALFHLLDLGDLIGVRGHLFRTKTDELSIWVEELFFLSKALLPLPEKWHGLTDVELRYRQRYLDLIANDKSRQVFVTRTRIIQELRRLFDARGYIEVETPMMHPIPGGAAARPFVTHHNTLDIDLYLRIAPELYLKRLTVAGFDRVYEINRNFRNEGVSTQHNPEFTMLEFYQAYSNYHDLMQLTQELIIQVAQEVNGTTVTNFAGQEIDLSTWRRFSMREAILEFWPESAGPRPGMEDFASDSAVEQMAERVREARISLEFKPGQPAGKTIAGIFEAIAEDHLIQPTIIYDFPVAVSPLSKNKPEEPDWVERFEFYVGGFELGNAFSELNDPEEQRRRFEQQLAERERGDTEAHVMDEDYVRALAYGLPPTAGEGIGIDRLTMVLTGSKSIRDVILFPLLRSQSGTTAE